VSFGHRLASLLDQPSGIAPTFYLGVFISTIMLGWNRYDGSIATQALGRLRPRGPLIGQRPLGREIAFLGAGQVTFGFEMTVKIVKQLLNDTCVIPLITIQPNGFSVRGFTRKTER